MLAEIKISYLQAVLFLLLSFFISWLATKLLINSLKKFGLIDRPSARRLHSSPTPRGGGLAIVLSFLVCILIYAYFSPLAAPLGYILRLLLALAFISFMDDLEHINIVARLALHLICAFDAVYLLIASQLAQDYYGLKIFIIGIILAGFINIYNFLDGTDGLSCTCAVHISLAIILVCLLRQNIHLANYIIISSCLVASASLGFLVFNFHPAKIFLGDVGSISLGFILGINLALIATSSLNLFITSIIISMYHLADGGLTILIRLFQGKKPWQAHTEHFFQQALQKGMRPKIIVYKIMSCNFILMICALLSLTYPVTSLIVAAVATAVLLLHFSAKVR